MKQCQAIEIEDLDRPVETDEVLKAVNRLKFKKASGTDKITAEMIKGMGNDAIEFMKPFFKKLLKTGTYPTVWSRVIIVPVHKTVIRTRAIITEE